MLPSTSRLKQSLEKNRDRVTSLQQSEVLEEPRTSLDSNVDKHAARKPDYRDQQKPEYKPEKKISMQNSITNSNKRR